MEGGKTSATRCRLSAYHPKRKCLARQWLAMKKLVPWCVRARVLALFLSNMG